MQIKTLVTGPVEVNTYVISGGSGKCIVIDPADAAPVKAYCEKSGLTPEYILLTHGHFDHILGVAELQRCGAKVYIHKEDAECLNSNHKNLSLMSGMGVPPCTADTVLSGGETLELCGFSIKVINTPGHTAGGVSYLFENERVLFTGDALFRLSVGRCDLPGGDARTLYDSIVLNLFSLSGDYRVCPGHMGESTLEYERKNNPFLKRWSPDIW